MGGQMWIWLLVTIGLMAGMFFYHKRKSDSGSESMAEFSNATMFFDPIKGEGDVFLGGILVIICFSLFLLELAHNLKLMFG